MGNELSNGSPSELETMKRYQGMSPGQVRLIKEKFELMADEDLTIDKNGFSQLMKLKPSEVDKVFNFFDLSNDGRIDSHEFVCALALLSQAPLKEKASILFSLYDFDHNRTITKNEMVILIKTTLTSLGAMSQKGECSIMDAEKISDDLLRKYDTNNDATISLLEFQSMVTRDAEIIKMLFSYGLISQEDMRTDFSGSEEIPEPDSDLEREVDRKSLAYDQKLERRKYGMLDEDEEEGQLSYQQFVQKKNHVQQWKTQIAKVNQQQKFAKGDLNPPAAWLDLEYIYGFRCYDSRNNIKALPSGEIVYPVAAVAVVLDPAKNSQKYFFEHCDDVACIDVFGKLIATGSVGVHPIICVWEAGDVSKCVFNGLLTHGINNLCFTNDGKRIAAIGMDPDHTIAIYDVENAIKQRGITNNSHLIASGKGPKSFVFDAKFDKADKSLVLACKSEVWFCTIEQGQVKMTKGLWDQKTSPISSVLSLGCIEQNMVSGTQRGYVILWKQGRAISSQEGHKGGVLSLHTRDNDAGVISGGRDGVVVFWDAALKLKDKIVVANLNLKCINTKVSALTEVGQILYIGTRGGDIIEYQQANQRMVMKGHSQGNLRGLAMHPKLHQFFTIGEDNLLACWNIKEKKLYNSKKLDYPSYAIHISKDAKFLAVGSMNGTVLIIDPKTLQPTFNFKDRDAEVSCIKFSHDGEMLAVGHSAPSCDILIYSIKNHFKRINILRGSPARVISIDFSMNCKVLQVNDWSQQVLYYELISENSQKIQPDGAVKNHDEKWGTYTAIYGWSVQGVWPPLSGGNDINSVDRSNRGDLVATSDDYSSVKLFRFPAAQPGQGFHRFVGHAAHVTMVRFSYDDDYLVSLGGSDKSIFQWRVGYDKDVQLEQDSICEQIPDIIYQSEYLKNTQLDQDEIKQENTIKQYLGAVKASVPSVVKTTNEIQGNLQLEYIHGVKVTNYEGEAQGIVNQTQDGKQAVYCVGAICVLMDTTNLSQKYYRGHQEEVNCMAVHPLAQIVASGGRALSMLMKPVAIHVWESNTCNLLCQLDFHTKFISTMTFTPNGVYLISAGGDDAFSIAVHDWQANTLIAAARTGNSPTYSISAKDNHFIAAGLRNVRFYGIQGRNLKCIPGSTAGLQFESMTASILAFGEYITGSNKGNLFLWRDHQSNKSIKAHSDKVTILAFRTQLYSGSIDGKIIVWDFNQNSLTQVKCVLNLGPSTKTPAILSLSLRANQILIGTKGAEIYKATFPDCEGLKLVSQAHSEGELWGLTIHPLENKFVTCGGDLVLRIWDLTSNRHLMASAPFENDIRAIEWTPDGQFILAGDVKGLIYLIDPQSLIVRDKKNSKFSQQKAKSLNWIQDMKVSPDSLKVAFGAHGTTSHLEIWDIDAGKFAKSKIINISLQGSLLSLDWSKDGSHIQVCGSNYELKFVNISKDKEMPAPTVRDLEWDTYSALFGWAVQSIQRTDEFFTTAVCASRQMNYILAGYFDGVIQMYKYPAAVPNQVFKTYKGHASLISRIRFSPDDSRVITISNLDRAIMIWKTDFSKNDQQQQIEILPQDQDDDIVNLALPQVKIHRVGGEKYGKVKRKDNMEDILEQDKGDEFVVVKPWMGALKEPSWYYKDALNQSKAPLIDLQIDWVHGYRQKDCRNNVRYARNGNIVYNAAGLGIVLDPATLTQKFFKLHTDDVLCIDINGDKVATGETGANPSIYVWDINTQAKYCQFKGQFKKGIQLIAFNHAGDKLAAVALDEKHTIGIFDLQAKSRYGGAVILLDQIGVDLITELRWKNDTEFGTCGINHFRSWKLLNGGLSSKRGVFNKSLSTKFTCIGATDDYILGATDGSLQFYKEGTFHRAVQISENNKNGITALHIAKDYIICGCRDGKIQVLEAKDKVVISIKVSDFVKSLNNEIKSIQLSASTKSFLIGTAAGEIFELTTKDGRITPSSQYSQVRSLIKSHYCPNKRSQNEVWGLAVNPLEHDLYYTVGDDATLRCWSILNKRMIAMVRTVSDQNNQDIKPDESGDYPDSVRGRCIAVSPDGIYLAVGFKDGTFRLFDKDLRQKRVQKLAKEWISDIKFSPDQQYLAIASHDNTVYLYTFPDINQFKKPLKKHSSYITHIDFSLDSNYLHSNSGSYELLFWDVQSAKQLPNGASALRDEKWATWTATLGWPVQGIWPEIEDGTEINTVARSNLPFAERAPDNYNLIAVGDDHARVQIFRYPCVRKGGQSAVGKGHSSHITNVAWSSDDKYLLSTGGEDGCIIQWRVYHQN